MSQTMTRLPSMSLKAPTMIIMEINECPDTQAAEGEYLEDAGTNLADIKPVSAEYPEEPTQQQRGEAALGAGVQWRHSSAGRCAAVRAGRRQAGNDLAAAAAELLIGRQRRHRLRHYAPSGLCTLDFRQ